MLKRNFITGMPCGRSKSGASGVTAAQGRGGAGLALSLMYRMETEGRLIADYSRYRAYRRAVSLAYQCKALKRLGILSATGLRETAHRKLAVVAG